MSQTPSYKSGSWNVLCDSCGFRFKAEELRKQWNELMVCSGCFELRHPQDYIRPPDPTKPLPWTRPQPPNRYVTVPYISESTGLQETTIPSGNTHGDL